MSVNRHQPHLLILPEDDANQRIANGFLLESGVAHRCVQIDNVAGGWMAVLDVFEGEHAAAMRRFTKRIIILLIDFDEDGNRLAYVSERIPADLRERVFVLGSWKEAEDLGKAEPMGRRLAQACRTDSEGDRGHELLRHNSGELEGFRPAARAILFP